MVLILEMMEHATFTIIVIAGTVVLTGPPKTKIRYRILSFIFLTLCVAAALQWSAFYFVEAHYHPEADRWPHAVVAVLFVGLALAVLIEAIALRIYERNGRSRKTA